MCSTAWLGANSVWHGVTIACAYGWRQESGRFPSLLDWPILAAKLTGVVRGNRVRCAYKVNGDELMSSRPWLSRVRTIAAWMTLAALVSVIAAHHQLNVSFPGRPWPDIARPSAFVTLLWWRNVSILAVVGFGLLSIPRWQSIVGIIGLITFLYFSISTY